MNDYPDAAAMADQAWSKVADAMERGKPAEARAWLRLMQDLRKLAESETEEAPVKTAPVRDPTPGAAEHDRLKALIRSGRARPADHLAFKAARQAMRAAGTSATSPVIPAEARSAWTQQIPSP
jgi:hypothetical protein